MALEISFSINGRKEHPMNRAGGFISNLSGEMSYQSFRPAPLPPNPPISLSNELVSKLIDANMDEWLAVNIPRQYNISF